MLFNSYEFVIFFLPAVLLIYYLLKRVEHRYAVSFLTFSSLFFYAWWNPKYLLLILFSIGANYAFGSRLGVWGNSRSKLLLTVGVMLNLGLLGYFKYANFFVDNITWTLGSNYHIEKVILPLAISFFTFQQIAYLVDSYRGRVKDNDFMSYCLFVSFFPQLIAGPIVHHKEMLPQFSANAPPTRLQENLAFGLVFFVLGLFKKVVIADNVAQYATPIFQAADQGVAISTGDAWIASLAYTFQLYFDFSGYSDMAIGAARMFGIRLPLNFNSPYKSANIIDFWRRWHMTLSQFLRDYVYIALGGNRLGNKRRYINLMATMLLGGLWHGAGWNFVIWGGLHGLYLVINHNWNTITAAYTSRKDNVVYRNLAFLLTFLAVVIAWVFFRAETYGGAMALLSAMFGLQDTTTAESSLPFSFQMTAMIMLLLFIICRLFPNTADINDRIERFVAEYDAQGVSSLGRLVATAAYNSMGIVLTGFAVTAFFAMGKVSEFLYFQF